MERDGGLPSRATPIRRSGARTMRAALAAARTLPTEGRATFRLAPAQGSERDLGNSRIGGASRFMGPGSGIAPGPI